MLSHDSMKESLGAFVLTDADESERLDPKVLRPAMRARPPQSEFEISLRVARPVRRAEPLVSHPYRLHPDPTRVGDRVSTARRRRVRGGVEAALTQRAGDIVE